MRKLVPCLLIMFFVIGCAGSAAPSVEGGNEEDIASSVAATVEALNTQQEEEQEPTKEPIAAQKVMTEEELSKIEYFKDEITNDIWLSDKNTIYDLDPLIVRWGIDNRLQMAMRDNYEGDDWIFLHSVVINTGENVCRFELCEEGREVLDGGRV